jgi:hypothetical protein
MSTKASLTPWGRTLAQVTLPVDISAVWGASSTRISSCQPALGILRFMTDPPQRTWRGINEARCPSQEEAKMDALHLGKITRQHRKQKLRRYLKRGTSNCTRSTSVQEKQDSAIYVGKEEEEHPRLDGEKISVS